MVPVLFTFYVQSVLKLKKIYNSGTKRLTQISDARKHKRKIQNITVETGYNILQINPVREGMNTKRNGPVTVITENVSAIGFNYHSGLFPGETDQLIGRLGS